MTGTDKKSTGRQDEGMTFGVYDYGAHFHSTKLGRFRSADLPTGRQARWWPASRNDALHHARIVCVEGQSGES